MVIINPHSLGDVLQGDASYSSQQPMRTSLKRTAKKNTLKINGRTMTISTMGVCCFLKDVGCSLQGVYLFFTIFRFELISLGVNGGSDVLG